ncbi:MAG: AI-2E family transporter [Bacteroidales bacterium]|nr:AI-2E family transporter [Bacteroidales bacterium]MCF8404508.1 AI-2E family transporter [Bacteroidales bacterium]
MLSKYKNEIIIAIFILIGTTAFYFLYGLLLPFIFGLLMAFVCKPAIRWIQKLVRNKDLATGLFLAAIVGTSVIFFVFMAQYISRDFNRLNHSFQVVASENQDKLNSTQNKVKEYIGKLYDFEALEEKFQVQADSIAKQFQEGGDTNIDTEAIGESLDKIISFFQKDHEHPKEEKPGFGFMFIFISSILYFVLILFNMDYFVLLKEKYLVGKVESRFQLVIDDFNQSFVKYFKLRTQIVLLLSVLYILAFIVLDLPGMIIFTILIILLSYIPYFQYIVLIPISIACLVLSIENDPGFLFYFGIITGVFVVASIIEELVLNPWIMEKNIGMNPVIMVLGLSVWSYLLGVPGVIIGIPLTSLIIIYTKRYFIEAYQAKN